MEALPPPPADPTGALPAPPTTAPPEGGPDTSAPAGPGADAPSAPSSDGSDAYPDSEGEANPSDESDPAPDTENVWEPSVDPRSQSRERERRDHRNRRFRLGGIRVDARGMGNAYGGDHLGDTVFNVTTGPGGGVGGATAVPDKDISFLRDVHVPGGTDQRLARAFDSDRVVILHGRPETGRTASAIFALTSGASGTPVMRVAPEELVSELSGPSTEAAHYLVDSTSRPWPWNEDEMARVCSLVSTRRARLVVVTDDEDVPARWRFLLVRHSVPDITRLLRSHLTHHAGGEVAARALIERVRAHRRVDDCLDSIETPGEAAATAWLIADYEKRGGTDWLDLLARRLEANRAELLVQRARDLLRGMGQRHAPVDQAYVISSAVLDGHTLTTVVSAAGSLSGYLVRAESGGRPERRRIFERRLDRRLPHVGYDERSADPGDGSVGRTLRLRQPRLWGAILDVAWTEYELSREPLLTWLRSLCQSHSADPRVPIDAAQAIGRIAAHDFAIVEKDVLGRWILASEESSLDDFDPRLPLMAAWIVEMLVVEGSQDAQAFALLERWMLSGSPWGLLYALTAYGTSIASVRPEESFRAIDMVASEIGRSGAGRTFGSATGLVGHLVESAVVEAFDGDSPRARAMALEHLVSWHGDDRYPRLRPLAVRTLLKIAQLPTRCDDGSRGREFALLEWLVAAVSDPGGHAGEHESAEGTVEGIHDLWLAALRGEDELSPAWTVLDAWETRCPVGSAESATRARIDALLERVRSDSDPRLKERLSLYSIIRDRRNGTGRFPPTVQAEPAT